MLLLCGIIISIITLLILILVCKCSNNDESHQPYQPDKKEDFDVNTLYTKGKHCSNKFNDNNTEYKIPYSQRQETVNDFYCPCSDLNPECLLLKEPHFKIPEKIKSKCYDNKEEDNNNIKDDEDTMSDNKRKEMLLRYAMLKSRKLDRYPWFD